MLKHTHTSQHPAVSRALLVCAASVAMLALPLGARAAAPAMPQEAPLAAPAALPYGSGYERRQLALDERPPAAPTDALPVNTSTVNASATGSPPQVKATGWGNGTQGGSGPSGGRGRGRAR